MRVIIFGLIIGSALHAEAACNLKWKQIFTDLEATSRISEAMQIRTDVVEDLIVCKYPLEDLGRLTDLEPLLVGGEFFNRYKNEIANFILNYVEDFAVAPGFVNYQNIVVYNLLPKMQTVAQNLALREKLFKTVSSCQELIAITEPWEYPARPDLESKLKELRKQHAKIFCKIGSPYKSGELNE